MLTSFYFVIFFLKRFRRIFITFGAITKTLKYSVLHPLMGG